MSPPLNPLLPGDAPGAHRAGSVSCLPPPLLNPLLPGDAPGAHRAGSVLLPSSQIPLSLSPTESFGPSSPPSPPAPAPLLTVGGGGVGGRTSILCRHAGDLSTLRGIPINEPSRAPAFPQHWDCSPSRQ